MWVREASSIEPSSLVEPGIVRLREDACGIDAIGAAELRCEIGFQFRDRLSQIVPGHETPSQPNAVADRHRGYAMKGPALGQERRCGFDQDRLNGNAGALRDEGRSSLQTIDRPARRAGSFRKEQELAAGPEVLHRLRRRSDEVIVAYVAGQARRC